MCSHRGKLIGPHLDLGCRSNEIVPNKLEDGASREREVKTDGGGKVGGETRLKGDNGGQIRAKSLTVPLSVKNLNELLWRHLEYPRERLRRAL